MASPYHDDGDDYYEDNYDDGFYDDVSPSFSQVAVAGGLFPLAAITHAVRTGNIPKVQHCVAQPSSSLLGAAAKQRRQREQLLNMATTANANHKRNNGSKGANKTATNGNTNGGVGGGMGFNPFTPLIDDYSMLHEACYNDQLALVKYLIEDVVVYFAEEDEQLWRRYYKPKRRTIDGGKDNTNALGVGMGSATASSSSAYSAAAATTTITKTNNITTTKQPRYSPSDYIFDPSRIYVGMPIALEADKDGAHPFHVACEGNAVSVVRYLMGLCYEEEMGLRLRGRCVSGGDENSNGAINGGGGVGSANIGEEDEEEEQEAQWWAENAVNVNTVTGKRRGWSGLHMTAQSHSNVVMDLLLSQGASVDVKSTDNTSVYLEGTLATEMLKSYHDKLHVCLWEEKERLERAEAMARRAERIAKGKKAKLASSDGGVVGVGGGTPTTIGGSSATATTASPSATISRTAFSVTKARQPPPPPPFIATEEGSTPLHSAVRHLNPSAVKALLACGADVTAVDANNRRPIDCLPPYEHYREVKYGHWDIADDCVLDIASAGGLYMFSGDGSDGGNALEEGFDVVQQQNAPDNNAARNLGGEEEDVELMIAIASGLLDGGDGGSGASASNGANGAAVNTNNDTATAAAALSSSATSQSDTEMPTPTAPSSTTGSSTAPTVVGGPNPNNRFGISVIPKCHACAVALIRRLLLAEHSD